MWDEGLTRFSRDLTLEQAQGLRIDRRIEKLSEKMKAIMKKFGERDKPSSRRRDISDIPEFSGRILANEEYFEWVSKIEAFFYYHDYDKRKKRKIVESKLTGYASLWYDNLKNKRRKEDRSKIATWEQLKRHMRKEFVIDEYVQDVEINHEADVDLTPLT